MSAITIWPGAHRMCTRLPTSDLCLALVISTARMHIVTKVPSVPNPVNTLVTRKKV